MFFDQAGCLGSADLVVPGNFTLVPLPLGSPVFNPVERVWFHLKERLLSHRFHADYEAIAEAAAAARNCLIA